MVKGAAIAVLLALAWAACARASVLVPTYVLPPDSFVRDQRSLASAHDSAHAESQRTVKRLIGGHIKIKPEKSYGDPSKNSFAYDEKSESGKFAGVLAPDQSGGTVGWNQGIWDDGMLMSSAGEGKEASKTKEDDEDKKTLADQVAEGKYGLLQNEIFGKPPKRPGILSYESNSETRAKDNLQTLGGLKKDEIWLAEDHLLVLKGGSFPERTKESDRNPWPPIDNYEAPRRQVKLPQKPKVPPPFPVRLADDGPLVFLTPNGSIPAAFFPPFAEGEGQGSLSSPAYPFFPGPPYPQGDNQGNTSTGGAPLPIPPFPFLPGNASEGSFSFPPPINGSFPEGFPPGAAFLPPPSNQTDLYDEDDPSIYYPPPYNFSYRADYNNKVPAGPLVPGIVLPPPPDFFAPMEEKTTTETVKTTIKPNTKSPYSRLKSTAKRPTTTPSVHRNKYKTRPTTTELPTSTVEEISTTPTLPTFVEIVPTTKARKPQRIVQIPPRTPVRVQNLPDEITRRPKPDKPVYKPRPKTTSKPLSVSVIYDYPDSYDVKTQAPEKPYVVYSVPEKVSNVVQQDNSVSSTPVPLRAYYSQNDNIPITKLQPVYKKPNEPVASFYFYDEQPKTAPTPTSFFDGRNYYKTVPSQPTVRQQQNINPQAGFSPSVDVSYGALDQTDALFLWPQKQGTRTLTQEYFSIQKPRQQLYVQPQQQPQSHKRPDAFYQQIADIQQTIELFTTKRPQAQTNRHLVHKPKAITPRPVYQFSYQSNPRHEQPSFRAPKLDPEPFRPMVSYSKPFNLENEFNAITPSITPGYHQQYLIETVQVTTETPSSTRYYPNTKIREEDYDDTPNTKTVRAPHNNNHISVNEKPTSQSRFKPDSTTPNPVSHGYYTKQDERYLDDITKNSFDVFGQKLEDEKSGLGVTPPLGTVKTPIDNNINIQYAYEIVENQSPNPPPLDKDTLVNNRLPRPPVNHENDHYSQYSAGLNQQTKPPSLADDILVNDRLPRPTINPDSEFIPVSNLRTYNENQYRPQHHSAAIIQATKPPSLIDDTKVNDRLPRPPINQESEFMPISNLRINNDNHQYRSHQHSAALIQATKPPSLHDDTIVNDRLPRPPINPDSEFIPLSLTKPRQHLNKENKYRSQQYRVQNQVQRPTQFAGEQFDLNQPSLGGDIAVNYRRPLPPNNPDAEWVQPVNTAGEGRPGSFVSYRLPGDGAHVYFLTPQAAMAARERYRTPGYGR